MAVWERYSARDTQRRPVPEIEKLSLEGCSLRCRAPRMGARRGCDLRRKRLAICPNRAIFEEFFFPDRHSALQGVDQPAAGIECRGAMGRGNNNQDAGLANFQVS